MKKYTATYLAVLIALIVAVLAVPQKVLAVPSCQGIAITLPSDGAAHNGMPVYRGGETVTVSVTGSSDSNNVQVYWKSAYLPMDQSAGWNQIQGTYNPANHTFNGTWTIPSDPQEIILASNSSGVSGFCSGNPCAASCPGGAYWIYGGSAVCSQSPASCCSGCQRMIIVDPLKGLNSSNAIDTKDYLQINPGNYWEYTNTNYSYPAGDVNNTGTTRIEVEQPTLVCGHRTTGLRFLKDKAADYWGPVYNGVPTVSNWAGFYGLRWPLFYFDNDPRWVNTTSGAVWSSVYSAGANPLRDLGDYSADYGTRATVYFPTGSEEFYYAPYFFSPRFLPTDLNWHFVRRDNGAQSFNPYLTGACGYETWSKYIDDYDARAHGWATQYGWENISTPVYSGQAMRIIFLEYNADNPDTSFLLREDWYFAKGIGLVMIRVKNLDREGLHPTNCALPLTGECANLPMVNPNLEIKLVKKYTGTALTASSPVWVAPGANWQVNLSDKYTGYLEYQADAVFTDGTTQHWNPTPWIWAQDGAVSMTVPANAKPGKYTYQFRRKMPDMTGKLIADESLDGSYSNNLPWSNSVTVNFTPTPPCDPTSWSGWGSCNKNCGGGTQSRTNACGTVQTQSCNTQACITNTPIPPNTPVPIQGDLNNDNHVNIFDYNILVTNFGKTGTAGFTPSDINRDGKVDIFDYNILVGNFGK